MSDKQLDEISQNALLLFPLLKHLFSGDSGDPVLAPLRNQTYHVLRILKRSGPLPVSAIGKRLIIAKQNMTPLIDRLVKDGLVERRSDSADRRIKNILITEKGIGFLDETRLGLKEIVKENTSGLSDEDIQSFRTALRTLRTIALKLC